MKQYTEEQLDQAFDSVCSKDDWKDSIDAVIDKKDQDLVTEAIIYFTATSPSFLQVKQKGKIRVVAEGYRMGPAGDH